MSTDTPSLYEQQAVELKTMALQDMSQRAKNAMNAAADDVRELERENARLREELELIRAALTGDDYASLPSDLPTVRMAHTIRADHDKFRNQVRDTCHRAEQAEKELAEAKRDTGLAKLVIQQKQDQIASAEAALEQAEARALAAENKVAWQEVETADLRDDVKRLHKTVSECEERALENQKDAGRYRWLRDSKNAYPLFFIAQRDPHNIVVQFSGELADMNIDAAVAGAKHD